MTAKEIKKGTLISAGNHLVSIGAFNRSDIAILSKHTHKFVKLERAKTNIMVYMNQSVGIGEHSDIVEAIQEELDKMAAATDRIEMLNVHFS